MGRLKPGVTRRGGPDLRTDPAGTSQSPGEMGQAASASKLLSFKDTRESACAARCLLLLGAVGWLPATVPATSRPAAGRAPRARRKEKSPCGPRSARAAVRVIRSCSPEPVLRDPFAGCSASRWPYGSLEALLL